MHARITDRAFVALAGAAAMLFAADAVFLRQIHGLERQTMWLEQAVTTDLGLVRQSAAAANDEQHDGVAALAAELVAAKYQALEAAGSARKETQSYAQRLASRLAVSGSRQRRWVEEELLRLRTLTAAANDATRRLAGQLQEARSDASHTRTANARAGIDTRVLASDARALTGIAARQQDSIARLRAASVQDIFEFDLKKFSGPKQIAGVSLVLRGADPVRNRYSLAIITGASRIEANDRPAFEPLRLYASGGRRELELVVNEVGKDEIRGFIAAPALVAHALVRAEPALVAALGRAHSSGSAEMASLAGR